MSRLHRQKIKQRRHEANQVDTAAPELAVVADAAPAIEKPFPGLYMPEVDEAFKEGFAAGQAAAKKKKTGARAKRSSSKAR